MIHRRVFLVRGSLGGGWRLLGKLSSINSVLNYIILKFVGQAARTNGSNSNYGQVQRTLRLLKRLNLGQMALLMSTKCVAPLLSAKFGIAGRTDKWIGHRHPTETGQRAANPAFAQNLR
jgi:hypothetical protein